MCSWDYYNGDLSVSQLTATYLGIGNPLLLNVCIWTLHRNTYPVIVYKETRDITKRLQFAVGFQRIQEFGCFEGGHDLAFYTCHGSVTVLCFLTYWHQGEWLPLCRECFWFIFDVWKSFSFNFRGVTIRLATIRYISRYTTHDMVHDTIQNQLIYYQWKILKHCGMCHQYCYIKTVILARNSEFKINKDVHNHPCPKYLLLTSCVCKQNNKIS